MSAIKHTTNGEPPSPGVPRTIPGNSPEIELLRELVGHLSDISVSLGSIDRELERIREALDPPAPTHTHQGTLTPDEWFGDSR